MPGYIMHMTEAKLIIDRLCPDADEDWKLQFVAGNLLPDTKKKRAKVTSHFWNPETLDDMAIAPDLDRFLYKYEEKLHHPVVLGYYAHLLLDERFVHDYWLDMVAFYDDAGVKQDKKEDITLAEIKKTGERIPRDVFFSGDYYYGDYSKLNNFFVEEYGLDLEKNYRDINECPIEEVDKDDLAVVLKELKWIMGRCDRSKEDDIKVFDKIRLCQFLERTADTFVKEIRERNLGYE